MRSRRCFLKKIGFFAFFVSSTYKHLQRECLPTKEVKICVYKCILFNELFVNSYFSSYRKLLLQIFTQYLPRSSDFPLALGYLPNYCVIHPRYVFIPNAFPLSTLLCRYCHTTLLCNLFYRGFPTVLKILISAA